jgi:hypothetical protein
MLGEVTRLGLDENRNRWATTRSTDLFVLIYWKYASVVVDAGRISAELNTNKNDAEKKTTDGIPPQ